LFEEVRFMSVQVQFDPQVEAKAGAPGHSATGQTVREALYQVGAVYPALRLFNCEGEMRSVFHIRQGDDPIALDAPVADGDTVTLALS
jgi:hypothetical protein